MNGVHLKHVADKCNVLNLAGEGRNMNASLSVKHEPDRDKAPAFTKTRVARLQIKNKKCTLVTCWITPLYATLHPSAEALFHVYISKSAFLLT